MTVAVRLRRLRCLVRRYRTRRDRDDEMRLHVERLGQDIRFGALRQA